MLIFPTARRQNSSAALYGNISEANILSWIQYIPSLHSLLGTCLVHCKLFIELLKTIFSLFCVRILSIICCKRKFLNIRQSREEFLHVFRREAPYISVGNRTISTNWVLSITSCLFIFFLEMNENESCRSMNWLVRIHHSFDCSVLAMRITVSPWGTCSSKPLRTLDREGVEKLPCHCVHIVQCIFQRMYLPLQK